MNEIEQLVADITKVVVEALEDTKGKDLVVLNTTELTSMFQQLIVITGDSNRQVKSLIRNAELALKEAGHEVISVEGMDSGEWVLLDAGDVIVHAMLPAVRDYYDLEALWGGEKPSFHMGHAKPWSAADV
ncbi:MAG: ribosome silencing factor [Neisseriaceae bacterium]|nr:ribosome silencing factor [Neisseriaceae bacterium]MBP6863065.1 ribosome silencing factor [Neisseriaceae bacterium]